MNTLEPTEITDKELALLPRADALTIFKTYDEQVTELLTKAKGITVTDVEQVAEMKAARTIRLELKNLRVEIEKKRKELGEEALRRKQTIDAAGKRIKELIEPEEKRLLDCEEYADRQEAAFREDLKIQRSEKLAPYTDPTIYPLDVMEPEAFDQLLAAMKSAHEAKLEADKKAEADRLAAEKAAQEESDRIRKENDKLKAEAAAKEEELRQVRLKEQAEREVARQREQAALDAQRKAEADAQALKDAETARLKAEQDAKNKAERDRIQAEKEAAAAPDKAKLIAFADKAAELIVPEAATPDGKKIAGEVQQKVANFSKWIKQQAEAL